ncbi:hypothetical protein [Rhizobium sp. 'Codium 1']|uniref:hypothetical protein n=1 Tax=Rhizobium sp. 'Codium 1' TaxID=2940484 RepID=UPI001E2BFA58|nr:hypothetical protein [Rhizobium sp. 'Codium 1']MCC8934845.1 hypothetical protein [Rhizobium sp. 'Codium 1']
MTTKTKPKAPATPSLTYEKLKIDPALQGLLENKAERIFELGRRSTEQTFLIGDILNEVADVLEGPTFAKWVHSRCGIAARTATGFIAVSRNLEAFRDEMIDLNVSSTVLFTIAHAEPDKIRQVLKLAEEHGQVRVSDARAILSDGQEKPRVNPYDIGGVSGLQALIALKSREGQKIFLARLQTIVGVMDAALKAKRLYKEKLQEALMLSAGTARNELRNLTHFVGSSEARSEHQSLVMFPNGSQWARVEAVLTRLSDKERWPKMVDLRKWLEGEAVPVLSWAISKDRKAKLTGPDVKDAVDGNDDVAGRQLLEAVPSIDTSEMVEVEIEFEGEAEVEDENLDEVASPVMSM